MILGLFFFQKKCETSSFFYVTKMENLAKFYFLPLTIFSFGKFLVKPISK
jgi:hypothetical protein